MFPTTGQGAQALGTRSSSVQDFVSGISAVDDLLRLCIWVFPE